MRIRLPDGWPGIVGIVVLLGGMAALLGGPGATFLPVPSTVTGGYLGEFVFASLSEPNEPLVLGDAAHAYGHSDETVTTLGATAYAERHRSVVALFDDEADAAAAFAEFDLPDGTTLIGVDRLVMLIGLPTGDAGPDDLARPFLNANQVLVEGDRGGEGSIVMDLRCTATSDDVGAGIARAIGDYGAVPHYAHARPPWLGPALTPDEELARATYRRWTQAYAETFQVDPFVADWGRRYASADSAAERAALQEELNQRLLERAPTLQNDVHPGVIEVLTQQLDADDPDGYVEWGRDLGRLMGPIATDDPSGEPSWFDQRHGGSIGSVRAVGRTIEIGWATFNTFAIGGLGLLAYLHDSGCQDVRVTLSDFDDVRGD